jgi:hypothetical protein
MALLDYFFDYHQIYLHKEDEKTSFITPFGTYCNLRCPKVYAMQGQHFAE